MSTSIIASTYILHLFATIINVSTQTVTNFSITLQHRKCFVVAESSVYSMINKPMVAAKCTDFICWQSHLTVISKANITRMYNNFRNDWAAETSISIMKMNWHWILEDEALKIISSCPDDELREYKSTRNIEGLDDSLACEYSVAVISSKNPSQEDFLQNFSQFLDNNSMRDFDENMILRRANVLHFGCALTVTNTNNSTYYFVCVYCSKEKSVSYLENVCLKYTEENQLEFPHLCHDTKYIDLYGCEPSKICNSSQPEVWRKHFPGELEQIYVVNRGQEMWLFINRTIRKVDDDYSITEQNDVIFSKPSDSSWIHNYSPLSEYCCVYDEETMNILQSENLSSLTKNLNRFKRADKTSKAEKPHEVDPPEEYYPSCCIYLFILNTILFIGLLVLVSFTFQHYKSKYAQ